MPPSSRAPGRVPGEVPELKSDNRRGSLPTSLWSQSPRPAGPQRSGCEDDQGVKLTGVLERGQMAAQRAGGAARAAKRLRGGPGAESEAQAPCPEGDFGTL